MHRNVMGVRTTLVFWIVPVLMMAALVASPDARATSRTTAASPASADVSAAGEFLAPVELDGGAFLVAPAAPGQRPKFSRSAAAAKIWANPAVEGAQAGSLGYGLVSIALRVRGVARVERLFAWGGFARHTATYGCPNETAPLAKMPQLPSDGYIAVVIGAGFIGLEVAENLVRQGIDVTIVEATPQVLPPLDAELAVLVCDELVAHGVRVETGATLSSIEDRTVTLADGRVLAADLVVGAIGVRPDVRLAELAGLELGPSGGIAVNEANQTNDPDVYAVGDAVEKPDAVSHATSLIALANVANRQGRRVADHIAGRPPHAVASLGTAIVKVFDVVAATVGWSERRLRAAGRPFRAIHSHPFDHATYYPGATRMAAKLLFDPDDGTILGAQIVGRNGVDKRIDVIATAMSAGMSADRLADLELAYAPPFSSAKDPVNILGYMADNVLAGDCDVVDPHELDFLVEQGWTLVDVRTQSEHDAGAIPGSISVPLDSLRDHLDTLGKGPVVVYCEVGQRGHTATALLHELGFQARNLDGGYQTWSAFIRTNRTPTATPTS